MNEYIYKGKKKLRCGYTTGSCAAAAAKAAAKMLLSKEYVRKVELLTPKGISLSLAVSDCVINDKYSSCAVRKDSGDDPDVTNGVFVYAKCQRIPFGIEITGGEGIGKVTKAGLDQPIGEYAINSVPRKMIRNAVEEICEDFDYHAGIRVTVSIPMGSELAKKTFNPRIGIVGGISVIGTTGIVEPMSNEALTSTIRTEQQVLKAQGEKSLLLTVGNYSKSFIAKSLPLSLDRSVTCSNFIGEALDIALELDFESVLIVGHIGKLVKLGAGIMNTHSAYADGRMEVLVTCGVLADVPQAVLKSITECATVDAALEQFNKVGKLNSVADILMGKASYHLEARVKGDMEVGAVMFSDKYGIIGMTDKARVLLDKMSEE